MADPWDFSVEGIAQQEQQRRRVWVSVEDYERSQVAHLPRSERDAVRDGFIAQQASADRIAADQAYSADIRAALDRAEDSIDPQALDRVCRVLWGDCHATGRAGIAKPAAETEPLASVTR